MAGLFFSTDLDKGRFDSCSQEIANIFNYN